MFQIFLLLFWCFISWNGFPHLEDFDILVIFKTRRESFKFIGVRTIGLLKSRTHVKNVHPMLLRLEYSGGSAWRTACKLINMSSLRKIQKLQFLFHTFTTVFKICLCTRRFDSSVCPDGIFCRHFVDSSKLLKSHLTAINWNKVNQVLWQNFSFKI